MKFTRLTTSSFAFVILLGCCNLALAIGPSPLKEIIWVAPTTRTDGSSLPPAEIKEFRLYCRQPDKAYSTSPIAIEGTSPIELRILSLTPGAYLCAIATADIKGAESALSAEVSFTKQKDGSFVSIVPLPPSDVRAK